MGGVPRIDSIVEASPHHLGKCSSSGRWRSGIARRWWWRRDVAGTDLHRPPRIADDVAQTVIHRLGCPVATRSVYRLGVTGGTPRRPAAGMRRSCRQSRPLLRPLPRFLFPIRHPSILRANRHPAPATGGCIRRRRDRGGDRRSREQAGKRPLHRGPPTAPTEQPLRE
jgi:hypothetical protein